MSENGQVKLLEVKTAYQKAAFLGTVFCRAPSTVSVSESL